MKGIKVILHCALVGSPCPDFQFNEMRYFIKEKVSLEDFKEKWLILDFGTNTAAPVLKRCRG